MAYVGDKIQAAIGQVFDAISDVLTPATTTVKLLKQTSNADTFTTVTTIADKWLFEYQAYRQQFVLQIADNNDDLTNHIEQATHVQIGNDAVYVITAADTIAPDANDFTWKIFCTRFTQAGQFGGLY